VLAVLDFDGTFTDAEAESRPFLTAFRAALFELLGRDAGDAWEEERARVEADPSAHGWRHAGIITAPAGADPYITAACVAQNLCARFGILPDERERNEALQAVYRTCYPLAASVPRPDARAVLETLVARGLDIAVVSNSRTDTVAAKIAELGVVSERIEVIGDARKFVLDAAPRDATFDALQDLAIEGLVGRKVIVQRGHYYDALRALWQRTGTTPADTLVCGDVFELDLALPLCLGAAVHLVHRPGTPRHELAFLEAHPRGGASSTLSGLIARLN
jgi:FMN phosphatase YigB (HAD superfamily)